MKLSHYLLLVVFAIYACESPAPEVKTSVSGQIINPKGTVVTYWVGDENFSDTLDTENKFNTDFEISKPTEIRFGHGDEITYIYLRPGDKLSLTIDTDEFDESITYSGGGAEINNYKASLVLMEDTIISTRQQYMLPPDSFELMIQQITDWKIAALQTFKISDKDFIDYTQGEFLWSDRLAKLSYQDNYEYLTGEHVELPWGFFAFESEIDLNDSTQLVYPSFQRFIGRKVSLLASEQFENREDSTKTYYDFYLPILDKIVGIAKVREDMIFSMLNMNYTDLGEEQQTIMYQKWLLLNPKKERLDQINEQIAKLDKLKPGQPAPTFTYMSIDGDAVSLEDFRGKLVYVDVWATWCGPCIREHPYMEKLQERFEGKDVVFIAVSTDSSPEPWKKMVREKELGGIHLYAPGAWNSTIIENYLIKGIPRFILIDQDGNLVNSDAARPSGNIGDQMEDLLKSV